MRVSLGGEAGRSDGVRRRDQGVARGDQGPLGRTRLGERTRVRIDSWRRRRGARLASREAERDEAENRPPGHSGGFHRAQCAIPITLRRMAATTAAALRPTVEPVVTSAGYDLEDVVVTTAGRRSVVRVVVDRDGGIDLDQVADVSRAVSEALDAANAFADSSYTLEVTSPGVDRPLTEPRHWRRNAGRLVEVGGTKGRILEVTDESVALDVDGERRDLPFAGLGPGKIIVEFSR